MLVLNNIEAERVRKGLTVEEISAQLGISRKTYSKYVKGSPIPSKVLLQLSSMFSCSVDYLLGLSENSTRS